MLIQPGDWPCQFFSRQLVHETIGNLLPSVPTLQTLGTNDELTTIDNKHPTPIAVNHPAIQPTRVLPPLAAAIPMMGPLHILINSREHVLLSFHPFFKRVYEHLFPNKKFPEKPKPWRISLLLEVVYGGWALIRDTTKETFHHCKNLQYGTLLNLLDNYLPLVLSIYAITFKQNLFEEFFHAMVRIWITLTSLKRRHHNKAILVWISMISHWKTQFPQMYNLFKTWITLSDEYPVKLSQGCFSDWGAVPSGVLKAPY